MSHLDPDSEHGSTPGTNGSSGALSTLSNHASPGAIYNWSNGVVARPEILSSRPSPPELVHAVRRRWPLAIGLGATVATVAAILVWFLIPVKYEAFALLKVSSAPPSVLKGGGEPVEFNVFKRTQVGLIKSGMVLQRTVAEPAINKLATMREHQDQPVSWLKEQMIIDYPEDSELLRVAMTGTNPGDLIKIVDEVVKKYLSEVVQRERDVRFDQERKLDRAYQEYAKQLEDESNALHQLEKVAKTSSTEAAQVQKKLSMVRLDEAIEQLDDLKSDLRRCEMQIVLLQNRKQKPQEAGVSDHLVDMEINKDPAIISLKHRLAAYKEVLELERARAVSPSDSKAVKQYAVAYDQLSERLEDEKATLRGQLLDLHNSAATNNNPLTNGLSLGDLEVQKEQLAHLIEDADENIKTLSKDLEGLETFSAAVAAKQDDLKALQTLTSDLRHELDRMSVEKLAQDRIVPIDSAVLASSSGDAMRKYVAVVFAALLGFSLVVLGVAYVEFQSRRLNSVSQVNEGLGMRVVGELPNISGRTWRRVKGGKGPAVLKALVSERMDGTRTALIHAAATHPPRVVMVTSAEPHEGKTTTATQLAASLARSGRRTLLVDADIRNPGAHRVFELPHEPGLCELLRGEVEREAVLQPTRTANLWLLPAGRADLKSVQALSTAYLGSVISSLSGQFEYVIIDSGPVLKVADPLMVGQHCDAAIVSVLRDVSKVPKVYEATERLRSVGINVLGSVVNGVNDDVARHGVELLMAETA